ncbi:restriction endonuclease subunit S [Staphylococcus coagulans]|uniref:restriction endonuclease subunit S n=1 Tax=Staphylococcus coagulans TaxID=74706 RepID=UPI0030EF9572
MQHDKLIDKVGESMRPELRFLEFDNDWEKDKLSNLGDFTSGGTPLKSNSEYWNGDIPWITTGDIADLRKEKISNFITEKGLKESSAKLIKNKAIIIAMYGQGKTRGMSAILNFNATTNQACAIFQTKFDINFVYQFFQKSYKDIRSLSNEGSQKNLSLSLLKDIYLNYPCKAEQQKIGDFFSKLDHQIELEEKKLALLEEQKKGYMQKIFSQEVRFKDENGNDYPDWEETTLKNITNYISSKKSSNQYYESNNSKGYPVYDAIQEIGKDLQYDMEEPYISILKDGAGAGRLNLRAGKSSVIGTMGYIQANNVDIQFLYYRIKLINFRKFIIGSTIPHLYYKDYSKEKILIPTSNDEQKKIGHFILNIDKLIDNKTLKLDYLKQRKQGLLQRMFV